MKTLMDRRDFIKTGAAVIGAAATLGHHAVYAQEVSGAATLYVNGFILTMEGNAPEYVEAVVVKDGKITFAGTKADALAKAPDAIQVNLAGRTMMPGFIDSWGHFTLFAQQTLGVNLGYFAAKPPHNKADAVALLKAGTPFNGWIMGNSYDATMLSDGGLSLTDLDQVFPDVPVIIATLSTLTGQVNSAGIARLGLTTATKVVQPGAIIVDPKTGKLTGELLFTPYLEAQAKANGALTQAEALKTFQAAEALLAAQGYTTVQTYQLDSDQIANLRAAFDQGLLSVDVIGVPSISDEASTKLIAAADWTWGAYSHGDRGLKIPGYIVSTDASPQLRLAAFTKPYLDTTGFSTGWKGMMLPQGMVEQWVGYAYANDIQLFCYSNGDAGIDLSLAAIRKAIATSGMGSDRRNLIAHSYYVRQDQLQSYAELDLGISMMPPHMMVYGDAMVKLLGPERANRESPMASALKAGLRTTMHCDCPSAAPNMMAAIATAVTRRTMSGALLGPEERVSPYEALLSVTRGPAYTYREEQVRGTIAAGKAADLVILDQNPLTVAPDAIKDIKVVETIKRGVAIYRS